MIRGFELCKHKGIRFRCVPHYGTDTIGLGFYMRFPSPLLTFTDVILVLDG